MRKAFGDDQPGEVHPALTVVEHDAVGGGDDLGGTLPIGHEMKFRLDFPPI